MILYRKAPHLRTRRTTAPEPPFWQSLALSPYGARRGTPVAVDYFDLRGIAPDRMEVAVCESVVSELSRNGIRSRADAPLLVDAAGFAETIFRRGEETLRGVLQAGLSAVHLISTHGTLPGEFGAGATVAIAAWPLDLTLLEPLFESAARRKLNWGIAVPVMFPATTSLGAIAGLAELAARYRPRYFASFAVETDPSAKQALSRALTLPDDEEIWSFLFHSDLDPVQVATERHIGALAESIGAADFIVPPRFAEKSNWNAAIVLTLTASRMLAMEHETELAGMLARSARLVADLDKPLKWIAESASLSIVEALDEVSADILTDWLESGRSAFVDKVNERWRLRRDVPGA